MTLAFLSCYKKSEYLIIVNGTDSFVCLPILEKYSLKDLLISGLSVTVLFPMLAEIVGN